MSTSATLKSKIRPADVFQTASRQPSRAAVHVDDQPPSPLHRGFCRVNRQANCAANHTGTPSVIVSGSNSAGANIELHFVCVREPALRFALWSISLSRSPKISAPQTLHAHKICETPSAGQSAETALRLTHQLLAASAIAIYASGFDCHSYSYYQYAIYAVPVSNHCRQDGWHRPMGCLPIR